jgi:hypothetical protein
MGFVPFLAMKWGVRKMSLHDEQFKLIEDPQEALDTFTAILETGRSLLPRNSTPKGSPRFCRVVPFKQS